MFYIVRDVADMQLKAGNYVEQLKQNAGRFRSRSQQPRSSPIAKSGNPAATAA